MATIQTSNLGYPRIGEHREWKKALEAYWAGRTDEETLLKELAELRLRHLRKQQAIGIDRIPVGDFTLYDHMLDMAVMFGMIPQRFGYEGGPVPLATYFAMARGNNNAVACEMTKWFNTNYHYIVPEYTGEPLQVTENKPLLAYREAKEKLGIQGKPVMVGPYTFVKLCKGYHPKQLPAFLLQLVPLYARILQELAAEGVEWVQMDEPILVTSLDRDEMATVSYLYRQLHDAAPQLNIMLQTYFDAVEWYEELIALPVQGIGLDFVHGGEENLRALRTHGFPADKTLGLGLIDGRNVWRADLRAKHELLKTAAAMVPPDRIWLQPSCSLLHVPVNLRQESHLPPEVRGSLAFADEKLGELALLADAYRQEDSKRAEALFAEASQALDRLARSAARNQRDVHQAAAAVREEDLHRSSPFAERRVKQQQALKLPLLPTTTIGSFPQTAEVRQARQKWRSGEWSQEQYDAFIRQEIKTWIAIQEEIGLDVLVHGELERTDMVEFFGEKLGGFAFTRNGWVQSYGSRCVRPPIIYGDVVFQAPMTVKESVYAQSLTSKPVKGMLTGPVTILNWSFVRDDLSRQEVACQIALALRQEVAALEEAGIRLIQVDEPALREGLPLKKRAQDAYIEWAVNAFRLTTSSVRDTTQIHTHMCYCEFHDFLDAIHRLDADVISIETSRSHGELIAAFEARTYDKGIGLGVYDIHSPRIPDTEEIRSMIERGLQVLDPSLFWINPDCGLKTRGTEETIPSLRNMVRAAQAMRRRLAGAASQPAHTRPELK
ncbi:5-methyltetrahydropteroyltriglutamate--homocysteine S-methyltransferase [Brevibacillus sp. SYP-B805]|uniref:5-methyltetrahydropteroyltriglutamate-- homocysteine S-methyltransferase n=1 Tax=Brevibacillus sp. SYP-B805 TaxID=1578199 RepID=UPI0019D0C1FC|nr:5-methyltetrahydropteroyltriglutamate--homocysteine S-methyltransferase [Brevibacillus sp. SYP-B805]